MLGATLDITDRKRGEIALARERRTLPHARQPRSGRHLPVRSQRRQRLRQRGLVRDGRPHAGASARPRLDVGHSPRRPRTRAAGLAASRRQRRRLRRGIPLPAARRRRHLAAGQRRAAARRSAASCIGYIGTIADITARKEAEAALRNSERMYRAIGESIDYGIWVCDAEGRNIYSSESFLQPRGHDAGGMFRRSAGPTCCIPTTSSRRSSRGSSACKHGDAWDVEHRFRGVDGKWHPVLARGVPVRNEADEIIAWVGINLDISELKQVENELRESESRFRNMADNAPVLIWVHGVGGCQYVNKEYMRFVGGSLADVQGMNWTNYIHPDDVGLRRQLPRGVRSPAADRRPVPLPPGRRRVPLAERHRRAAVPPRRRVSRLRRLLGRHHRHQEVRGRAPARPIAARTTFSRCSATSCAIRWPASSPARRFSACSIARRRGRARCRPSSRGRPRYMSRIVDDLLDVSRIARGKLRLRHQYANLRQLLQDTVDDYRKGRSLEQVRVASRHPRRRLLGVGRPGAAGAGVLEHHSQQLQVQRRPERHHGPDGRRPGAVRGDASRSAIAASA